MKRFSILVSLLVLAACQPAGDGGDTVKIGFIGPLTGDAATYGADGHDGARMRIDEINAVGGINGKQITFIAEDARCTGAEAASAAQKLIHVDKVVAIIGGQCSGETLAAAPIAEAAQIPLISGISTSPDITEAGDFVFRTIPDDGLAAIATINYFEDVGYEKVAIITENTDFATAFADSLKDGLGEKVVFAELVDPNTKDFRTLVTRLQNTDFDVFVANGQTVAIIAAMVEQLREQGLTQPIISNNVADSPLLSELAGEAAEGVGFVVPPSTGANVEEFEAFTTNFRSQYGEAKAAMIYAAFSYDAMGVLAEAIEAVGTDGPAIRDYLYAVEEYRGASATVSFDENGDVIGIPFVLKEIQNGQIVEVRPLPL